MANEPPQRAYRAACPGCGAPLAFASAQSTHAVCGYCSSTVVRRGEVLARVGKMAELFDDHSPLQLLACGKFQGTGFRLIGRLQYQYAGGRWSEWLALMDDGSSAVLSEDNGAYVFSKPSSLARSLPSAVVFRVGMTTAVGGKRYSVASNEQVVLISAQGELPKLPPLGRAFAVVDLRSEGGEVLSLDYMDSAAPQVSLGQSVQLDDLQLSGLAGESAKEEKGRAFNCPNCGAPVLPVLAVSKSIACGSCHSVIDVSRGVGGELVHALQHEPVSPLIPLGTTGQLQGRPWQVVGYQHRMGRETGQLPGSAWRIGDSDDSDEDDVQESFGWSEYLLYHQRAGFCFLVDASDGWSLVRPLTGAPDWKPGQSELTYQKLKYRLQSSYDAETTYVAGEFYWQVQRGQKTSNHDFASGKILLSREQGGNEITWSKGHQLSSELVARAFNLQARQDAFKRSDASPLSASSGIGVKTILIMFVVLIFLSSLLSRCSRCDPQKENCQRSSSGYSGGSGGYSGGYSGGGSHK
ncbi:MAG: DUF4178 domain-containing protein [Burkholderiaceae bacterium]